MNPDIELLRAQVAALQKRLEILEKRESLSLRCLDIRDENGVVRAALWSDERGALFELYGADGTRRLAFMARDEGGQMAAMSDAGTPRVSIGVAQDHGQIAVCASGGDVVAAISASNEGGRLILADGEGVPKLELPDDEGF
ncbi:MAG: DUF1513 domain-containing protein [Armatimonadetes bacterium]|nr:DUF1513 domain-containing protein [Armatimonadota bacterium]